jgi:single-stranded-DNA-specific exonuclease
LRQKIRLPKLRPYLEIAGLATLADMVPLVGENRLITYFGFRELERSSFPALRALLSDLRYGITERDLQLSIIPRINACFRLGRPELFFNFLKEKDETKIEQLLKEIDSLNEERKSLSVSLWERVLERLERGRKRRLCASF